MPDMALPRPHGKSRMSDSDFCWSNVQKCFTNKCFLKPSFVSYSSIYTSSTKFPGHGVGGGRRGPGPGPKGRAPLGQARAAGPRPGNFVKEVYMDWARAHGPWAHGLWAHAPCPRVLVYGPWAHWPFTWGYFGPIIPLCGAGQKGS